MNYFVEDPEGDRRLGFEFSPEHPPEHSPEHSPEHPPEYLIEQLMEQQLQKELLGMFEIDSQRDLENYIQGAQQLTPSSWKQDIQSLYRAIHTIKGGAVTVRAEGALAVAAVLEDLLSDLRYLETAPVLTDGMLQALLQEGGELLAIALAAAAEPDQGIATATSLVTRLLQMRQEVQMTHVGEWDAQTQLRQEFIQDGFDLVVLDLEIALSQMSGEDSVDLATKNVAEQVLGELEHIGIELEMPGGWGVIVGEARSLLAEPSAELWRSCWPELFQQLKESALHPDHVHTSELPVQILEQPPEQLSEQALSSLDALASLGQLLEAQLDCPAASSLPQPPGLVAKPVLIESLNPTPTQQNRPERKPSSPTESIQVPVPLERLEKSAHSMVETILAARTAAEAYQALQAQINQILAIVQDSSQFATQLRQLQDDYALLDNLQAGMAQTQGGPTPERYRKGYVTINRLLEMNLRLSEIGAEAEQTARQTGASLQSLDRELLDLKDTIEANQLIPFKNVAFRVRAIVRELTNRNDKEVHLAIEGESLEIDVGASRQLEPALLHLIRNAFDHGLEPTTERQALGKPEIGQLRLSLQRRGNRLVLQLQDDGRGIDPRLVEARARSLALPLTQTDTTQNLLAVLCQPGFSSQTEVSELSGRGVGMDVVAEQVARLGGTLTLETQLGLGTSFILSLPLPRLLEPCILAQAGARMFAIPADQVVMTQVVSQLNLESMMQISAPTRAAQMSAAQVQWRVKEVGGKHCPAIDLLTYWQPELSGRPLPATAIAIQIRPTSDTASFYVLADKLIGQQDLAIEPFPSPMETPQGILGLSLQPNGRLIPVLEGTSFILPAIAPPAQSLHPAVAIAMNGSVTDSGYPLTRSMEADPATPTILVVDDAALMRRRLSASLSAYGYRVESCADGLEAWNWLRSHPQPALMITDIEMPYLDGFSLTDRCRKSEMTQPILVISSRLAEEWSLEAKRVGATDFLTKGFSTSELLRKVEQLLNPVLTPS